MLRITPHLPDGEIVIALEGALSGPWVAELAMCWIGAATTRPGRPVCVQFSDVTHVDAAGRELMALMYRSGVRFAVQGFMMREIVREIAERVDGERRK